MFAAITAARCGHQVFLYEKNEKLGKKLFITGKGRCNLTNACDIDTLFSAVVSNSRFLYSSFYGFTNQDAVDFFEGIGLRTKVERGNRVFPRSDRSADVADENGEFRHLILRDGARVAGDACIVATGGLSYQTTGSTGDGYRFARQAGHQVTECLPSLVPMEVKESWPARLQGLSLRNVRASIYDGRKKVYDDFGEMLFTHYGVSGPLMLSASSIVSGRLKKKELQLYIDLKPALSDETLHQRVLRDFEENQNKQFKNAVGKLFPARLAPVMIELSGIPSEKKVNIISREERQEFVRLIRRLPVTLTGLRGYNEAVITKGGVKVREIDPATMESKLVKRLYFVGEVLDVDALTGGFNLQIAWSTAYAAGMAIGKEKK